MTPRMKITAVRRPRARVANAVSESVPPSPLLSARKSNSTYFSVTVISAPTRSARARQARCHGDSAIVTRRHRRFAKGIKRAGSDVAVNDADTAQSQSRKALRRFLARTRAIGSAEATVSFTRSLVLNASDAPVRRKAAPYSIATDGEYRTFFRRC